MKKNLGREEGIPWIWVSGGAIISVLILMVFLFSLIFFEGIKAFWPKDVVCVGSSVAVPYRKLTDSQGAHWVVLGLANTSSLLPEFVSVTGEEFVKLKKPHDYWVVERRHKPLFIGTVHESEETVGTQIQLAGERRAQWETFSKKTVAKLIRNTDSCLVANKNKNNSDLYCQPEKQLAIEALQNLNDLKIADEKFFIHGETAEGQTLPIVWSEVVRAYQANGLSLFSKTYIFISKIIEFVSESPRDANTAGGVLPALFGTIFMTIIMSIVVLPLGVSAAVYMREIAKQGVFVSMLRVAVGNLAGVPSIVYGVFGLGFFCYTLGVSIDQLLFSSRLPTPTYGTGGILWASLTLAFLTVPIVIVSTEEALSAVPRTLREASYGCGATRWQTLRRIVIPRAAPGIMTGLILAMARGVGEVAPLLLTGVVKLAPQLPVDTQFPYIHLERSFMHLGFHIYDLGFQSKSIEATRPMVFASTALLILIVMFLNLLAIKIRSTLRRRFEGRGAF